MCVWLHLSVFDYLMFCTLTPTLHVVHSLKSSIQLFCIKVCVCVCMCGLCVFWTCTERMTIKEGKKIEKAGSRQTCVTAAAQCVQFVFSL